MKSKNEKLIWLYAHFEKKTNNVIVQLICIK